MSLYGFEYRQAERDAVCRHCDKQINKKEFMISGYSWRNRGMYMHLHISCVKEIYNLIPGELK